MTDWFFDIPLALGLIWLGWRTVASPELFKAMIIFIVFGLFMALCWTRLQAPDLALAEAAIGAGLTGVLLLNTHRALLRQERHKGPGDLDSPSFDAPPVISAFLALLGASLFAGLGWILMNMPEPAVDLGTVVWTRLDESGVSNPVTAVLLNFRSYDTLLEVGVLLLALLGVWSVSDEWAKPAKPPPGEVYDSPLVDSLIRLLVPLIVLTAGYLLWAGSHAPGGAFQAGVVLATVIVLLRLTERVQPTANTPASLRVLLILGLGLFCAVALGVIALGGMLLEYPQGWAYPLILAIESTLTVSIALTLALLFSTSRGLQKSWS